MMLQESDIQHSRLFFRILLVLVVDTATAPWPEVVECGEGTGGRLLEIAEAVALVEITLSFSLFFTS